MDRKRHRPACLLARTTTRLGGAIRHSKGFAFLVSILGAVVSKLCLRLRVAMLASWTRRTREEMVRDFAGPGLLGRADSCAASTLAYSVSWVSCLAILHAAVIRGQPSSTLEAKPCDSS